MAFSSSSKIDNLFIFIIIIYLLFIFYYYILQLRVLTTEINFLVRMVNATNAVIIKYGQPYFTSNPLMFVFSGDGRR